jgi:effector-binding domain-containing protein
MLDEVWAFIREHGLVKAGHNVMVYEDGVPNVQVGVQVAEAFEGDGRVVPSTTPVGQAATAVHRGSPATIGETHDAVVAWCTTNGHATTGVRWEIYGDWTEDPDAFETEVFWQLAASA